VVLSASSAPAPKRGGGPAIIAAKTLVHALCLLPAVLLAWRIWDVYSTGSDALGADPVPTIIRELGDWGMRMLLIVLAVTPLRQLTGWTVLLRFRRMLGLYAFFYISLHLAAYVALDLRAYWMQLFDDIAKRPYITVGFTAWLLLIPLAVTSTRGWMRRLGRRWAQLHKAVYAIAILGMLHYWWQLRVMGTEAMVYAGVLAALLFWRLWEPWRTMPSSLPRRPPQV
jgi:methionine sulfoxide reductase heme-binding subunit